MTADRVPRHIENCARLGRPGRPSADLDSVVFCEQIRGRAQSEGTRLREDQTFRDLGQNDLNWLAGQRALVEALIEDNPDAVAKYRTNPGKLGVIRAVLDAKAFRRDQISQLQGLGIILGDALAGELGMKWKMVEDRQGVSPCLVLEGTSIVLFPQTMISKRIERGEGVDVFELFNGIVEKVEELRSNGA
jgi:hypothetical protein